MKSQMVYPGSGCDTVSVSSASKLERNSTYRVSERTGLGREVSSRRIPRNLAHTVVLAGTQQGHVRSRVGLVLLDLVIGGKVNIPEFEIVLDGKTDGGQDNESTLGRPSDGVDTPVIQTSCRFKGISLPEQIR